MKFLWAIFVAIFLVERFIFLCDAAPGGSTTSNDRKGFDTPFNLGFRSLALETRSQILVQQDIKMLGFWAYHHTGTTQDALRNVLWRSCVLVTPEFLNDTSSGYPLHTKDNNIVPQSLPDLQTLFSNDFSDGVESMIIEYALRERQTNQHQRDAIHQIIATHLEKWRSFEVRDYVNGAMIDELNGANLPNVDTFRYAGILRARVFKFNSLQSLKHLHLEQVSLYSGGALDGLVNLESFVVSASIASWDGTPNIIMRTAIASKNTLKVFGVWGIRSINILRVISNSQLDHLEFLMMGTVSPEILNNGGAEKVQFPNLKGLALRLSDPFFINKDRLSFNVPNLKYLNITCTNPSQFTKVYEFIKLYELIYLQMDGIPATLISDLISHLSNVKALIIKNSQALSETIILGALHKTLTEWKTGSSKLETLKFLDVPTEFYKKVMVHLKQENTKLQSQGFSWKELYDNDDTLTLALQHH